MEGAPLEFSIASVSVEIEMLDLRAAVREARSEPQFKSGPACKECGQPLGVKISQF
jgi:hypothetical protein